MTKKDYLLIAGAIKEVLYSATTHTIKSVRMQEIADVEFVAKHLAGKLEKDNPRFDKEKFLTACGVVDYSIPCQKCGGVRDVEALICNNCRP